MPKQPAHLVALEKTQAARALRSNTSQGGATAAVIYYQSV